MIEKEEALDQLRAFYHIYPSMAATIKHMEADIKSLQYQIVRMMEESKVKDNFFQQYKAKIQRIEKFLIEHGLIKLMVGSSRGRAVDG